MVLKKIVWERCLCGKTIAILHDDGSVTAHGSHSCPFEPPGPPDPPHEYRPNEVVFIPE